MTISTVIFDFGNVINRWEPEKAVASLHPTKRQAMAAFEQHDFNNWVGAVMDMGRDVQASLDAMKQIDPERHQLIQCYVEHIDLAHSTSIQGTAEVIQRLSKSGMKILGMTNCGAAAYDALRRKLPVIELMNDVFVSAQEGVCKPDLAAYELLLTRNELSPDECVFIDDKVANVDAAKTLGMTSILFWDAAQLESKLSELGLLNQEAAE